MRNERGGALIEAVLIGLLLLVPLMWLLGVLSDLQRGALASSAAAKEAGVEAARSSDPASMRSVVSEAVKQAFLDHGLDPRSADVHVRTHGGGRGAAIEVVVGYDVSVLQAPFLGKVSGPGVHVSAKHVARVDLYGSRP